MCVRKSVVGQGTYMLAPRSYRLLVSALSFALLASIAPNARAANPPDDLAKFLFLTQLGDMPDNAVVCPSFAWKPIPAALLRSLQVADSRFVRADECVKVMDVRIGSYHRPSGKHAYFFSIHDFRMLAAGRAVAKIDQTSWPDSRQGVRPVAELVERSVSLIVGCARECAEPLRAERPKTSDCTPKRETDP
jgi:hypothetical protein